MFRERKQAALDWAFWSIIRKRSAGRLSGYRPSARGGKGNECFELGLRGAGIDARGGEAHALEEVAGELDGQQRRGGVGQHDIATRARLAAEYAPNDAGVFRSIAAAQCLQRRARQAEVLGRDRVAAHLAPANFGNVRLTAQ